MLNETHIQQLKQSNISVDSDKVRERVETLWKGANSQQKQAVKALADIVAQTVYRVYNTGSISAKLAVSLGQVFNVDPFYLIGEVDEPGECTGATIVALLQKCGYKKLLAELEQAEKRVQRGLARRQKAVEAEEVEEPEEIDAFAEPEDLAAPAAEADLAAEEDFADEADLAAITLVEDDLVVLLQALVIRASAGICGAAEKLAQVQQLLLG
ncbi:MAG: hypothetical protein LBJ11_10265 [Oscillospiraceae bacterium]|jgi:hypothetical protein|nr:hypothetical protein [Oscillospiraceae bacterium]